MVSVWSGLWGALVSRGCDDDGGGSLTSSLDISLTGGIAYHIEAMRFSSGSGGALNLSVTLRPPPNDDFDAALVAGGLPYGDSENTTAATTAGDDPSFTCSSFSGQGYHTVWYNWTAPTSGVLTADTIGSAYDTVLGVFTGPRGGLTTVGCNDDAVGLQSRVEVPVNGGTTYRIEALGFSTGASGALDLALAFAPLSPDIFADGFESHNLSAWSSHMP